MRKVTKKAKDLAPGDVTAKFPDSPVARVYLMGHYQVRIELEDGFVGREDMNRDIELLADA